MYVSVSVMGRGVVVAKGASLPPVKSAVRTVQLLEHMAANRGLHSLNDIQEALGYPRSSLYVLLRTLTEMNWLETDVTGTLYQIGFKSLLVGTTYIDSDPVVAAARPTLGWISEQTTETVHLARLADGDVIYLATYDSHHTLRAFSRVGRKLPAYATALGKALLAERDDDAVQALVPADMPAMTSNTLPSLDALRKDLQLTRKRGYAVDHEENTVGVQCLAVPIRNQKPAREAVSCSVPRVRMTKQRIGEIAEILQEGRVRIEAATESLFRATPRR
jgi:IclR family acetate operon transcriptional repressor